MKTLQNEIRSLKKQMNKYKDELERLTRERNEFLRVSAHQMKSPITTIIFSIETLLKEYAGRLNWKQLRIIESIKNSTNNLQSLIHDILDLEKLRAEEMELKKIDFLEICREAIEDLHGKMESRGIDFETNFPHKTLITLGNPTVLRQVVYNLIENAIKYSHKRGEVDFTVVYDDEEQVVTTVIKDHGIGIPDDVKEHLFDEFYRAPNARIFDKTGTGFGLAIVKRVLDLCGGTIQIESKENEGTKVSFTLQLVKISDRPVVMHERKGPHRRIVVIGGVSAGPKAASRARRMDPDAEITLFEKEHSLAYAGCALPYYISGRIKSRRDLSHAIAGSYDVADFFRKVSGIDIKNLSEVIDIDRRNKTIQYRDLVTERIYTEPYDALILATGSTPLDLDVEGESLKNIFKLHGINDAERIKFALANDIAREIVIIGGGLIGTEIADALTISGSRVTIVEQTDQILSILDPEMASLVEQYMMHKGIRILKNETVKAFMGKEYVKSIQLSKSRLQADMVILAMGVKPTVGLARKAGLKIGKTGAISVNEYLQTSDPSIYAAGDCAESTHRLLEKPYYLPLGSIANRQGRVAGTNATGKAKQKFDPVAGTVIFKVFDYHVAKTGLNEQEVKVMGCTPVSSFISEYDREHFMPGSEKINIKMTACKKMKRLIGVQIIGKGDASKRVDLAALVISKKGSPEDLLSVDLGYAPAFSNAMGAIVVAANVLQNKLEGRFMGVPACEVLDLLKHDKGRNLFIDVRTAPEYEEELIEGTISIPLENLQSSLDEIPQNKGVVFISGTGARAYQAALILQANGYNDVRILEGGISMWPYRISHE
jgi:NADPH-dependent 2,4-dienoyl-CoA reductase/sulfur reductase-like enzyme/rhodanese-related sulfurtransferase/nitrogen-specific signal transduction histidine kinase